MNLDMCDVTVKAGTINAQERRKRRISWRDRRSWRYGKELWILWARWNLTHDEECRCDKHDFMRPGGAVRNVLSSVPMQNHIP